MADAGLSKVTSRVTVQDTVYEQLRRALMWGAFAPSQAITISSLAAEFGTSHMPVREAIRRLAAENGLEIGHNGSARVPAVSRQRLDDLCRARIALGSSSLRSRGMETGNSLSLLEPITRLLSTAMAALMTLSASTTNRLALTLGKFRSLPEFPLPNAVELRLKNGSTYMRLAVRLFHRDQ